MSLSAILVPRNWKTSLLRFYRAILIANFIWCVAFVVAMYISKWFSLDFYIGRICVSFREEHVAIWYVLNKYHPLSFHVACNFYVTRPEILKNAGWKDIWEFTAS